MERHVILGAALGGLACVLSMVPFVAVADDDDPEVIVIRNGRVHTMTETGTIDGGSVVIADGKITLVADGEVHTPRGAVVIDATGKNVFPGLIDAGTTLGLVEISAVDVTKDTDEKADPVLPQLRVIDGFNPDSALIPVARMNGITSVLTTPGEVGLFGGQSAFVRLRGATLEEALIKAPAAIHVNLGEAPKSHFGDKKQLPSTRMGLAALFRETLIKAREYQGKLDRWEAATERFAETGEGEAPVPPTRDLKLEALLPVLAGDIPLIVRAHRADDIGTALRLGDELGVRIVLRWATEAWRVAGEIKKRNVPVIVGPTTTQPETMETQGAIYENAKRLHEAGIKIAIQTASAHNVRNLPYEAGLAVTYGLPYEAALAAVTRNPAEILGVADRVGTLEKGKDADVIVVDGDPFQPLSKLEKLFIGGVDVPIRSRQTDLYERYRKKD